MIPTKLMLARIMPNAGTRIGTFYASLIAAMEEFDILDASPRVAMFLAQIAHESAELSHLRENLNYSADGLRKTWPKRFPTAAMAQEYARNQVKIANTVYANRMGNGPPESGDGWRFIGRGLIQVTGRSGYAACGKALDADLINNPELLEQPDMACRSAGWYWASRNLNSLADLNTDDAFKALTKKINGGYIGLEDRIEYWNRAREAFKESRIVV